MNNDKVIEEMLARIQALEEKVAALSGEDKKEAGDGEKQCLPGYNECIIIQILRLKQSKYPMDTWTIYFKAAESICFITRHLTIYLSKGTPIYLF